VHAAPCPKPFSPPPHVGGVALVGSMRPAERKTLTAGVCDLVQLGTPYAPRIAQAPVRSCFAVGRPRGARSLATHCSQLARGLPRRAEPTPYNLDIMLAVVAKCVMLGFSPAGLACTVSLQVSIREGRSRGAHAAMGFEVVEQCCSRNHVLQSLSACQPM
jgi:hypothetical protein